MYISYMQSKTFPLAVPMDLLGEVRQAAKKTGLSVAATMRQSMKLGLPRLVEDLATPRLRPMTREEALRCWGKSDPEFDKLAAHCAKISKPLPEDD
jgi:hypothetical protein